MRWFLTGSERKKNKEQKENNATVGITLQTKLGNYSFNNIGEEIYSIDLANYPGLEEIIFFVDADGYQYDKTTTINITNPTEATFNADKYVGEYTALVNGEYLTIKIVKNTDGTYKAMLPKASKKAGRNRPFPGQFDFTGKI